jgi:hypothetical protein
MTDANFLRDHVVIIPVTMPPRRPATTCRHCGRVIVQCDGGWVDPEATGDDSVWRETCDAHDTFTAEHEPEVGA